MIAASHAYYLPLHFFKPPKPKYLVLAYLAEDGRARFFVINSERTELQKTVDELRHHLLPIPRGTHDFLPHDSWLDCSEAIGGRTAAELEGEIAKTPECHVGKLAASLIKEVRQTVARSRILSARDKRLILEQWPNIPE